MKKEAIYFLKTIEFTDFLIFSHIVKYHTHQTIKTTTTITTFQTAVLFLILLVFEAYYLGV